ncbi:MAG: helical backbone metal receptor [Nocardioidaceae bacterium]
MSERVVSLVPSLTEAIAVSCPGVLVGVTDYCSHPADLEAVRVRGTKNPDVDRIIALAPDLVVVNREENRAEDIQAIHDAGLRIWLTDPETVPQALTQLRDLLAALGAGQVEWLNEATRAWSEPHAGPRRRVLVPIWRRPWMTLGRDTFAGDLLSRMGYDNVLADHADRYPKVDLGKLPDYDLVLLPDEPYAFAADDGPEAFPGTPAALVSGRHLTWYGPSLARARSVLGEQIADARVYGPA